MGIVIIVGVAAAAGIGLLLWSRHNELFYVSVRHGRCLPIRGHVPPSLFSEIRVLARRRQIAHASVKAVRDGERPRLVIEGMDEGDQQRLRNAFGARGFGGMRVAARDQDRATRNLGQLLGLVWLAWLLGGRD